MLVLRRKPGEAIVIGGTSTITILEVEGTRVKLGITAPTDVSVVRGELLASPPQPPSAPTPTPHEE